MGKIGHWTFWFKSMDGFDISFCTNKKDIPKDYKYVISMKVAKPGGVTDDEIMDMNKNVLWKKKNTHKMSNCELLNLTIEIQEKLHEFLNVPYPKKGYESIFKKKIKTNPKLKGCKIK